MKRKMVGLLKLAFSVVLIAWVVRSLDMHAVQDVLFAMSPGLLCVAALLFMLQTIIIGWRWHRIVALLGGRIAVRDAVRWVFAGLFFNNALPTSIGGDAVRVWLLRRSGQPLGLSAGSVAIERATGIVLLGLLMTVCLPAVWQMLGESTLRLLLTAIGPFLLAGLVAAALADRLFNRWLPTRLAGALGWLGEGLRQLAARPRSCAEIGVLGIGASLTGLLAAYVLGEGLGISLAFPAYVVLVGGSVLLSVLPVSVGGWGVREIGMVALFGTAGVDAERALALSLLWGLLPLLISMPPALFWGLGKATVAACDGQSPDETPPPTTPAASASARRRLQ